MKKWVLYVFILGFATYWACNLLLWFPWSYSTTLGITLMLSVAPLLWAYVTFLALQTFPDSSLIKSAFLIAIIFLVLSSVMDYIFFGIIRNAMEELYHPTTFYGYAFLLVWPFVLALIYKFKWTNHKRVITHKGLIKAAIAGLLCFGALTLIINLGIEI